MYASTLGTDAVAIAVDFTQPSTANENAEFFCQAGIPFVMGTTGGNREALVLLVEESEICAVIAPNMAAQVVALQSAIEYMSENFPTAFEGFLLRVEESHQKEKKDISGTAKHLNGLFARMGAKLDHLKMIREEAEQLTLGVLGEHLKGHGWHDYRLETPDKGMQIGFIHNINGRAPYVEGTIKALRFLERQIRAGVKGKAFTMIDVLRAG